jgi:hypothetical protein
MLQGARPLIAVKGVIVGVHDNTGIATKLVNTLDAIEEGQEEEGPPTKQQKTYPSTPQPG